MKDLTYQIPDDKELYEFYADAFKNSTKEEVRKAFDSSKKRAEDFKSGLRSLMFSKGNTLSVIDNKKAQKKIVALMERMYEAEYKAIAKVMREK